METVNIGNNSCLVAGHPNLVAAFFAIINWLLPSISSVCSIRTSDSIPISQVIGIILPLNEYDSYPLISYLKWWKIVLRFSAQDDPWWLLLINLSAKGIKPLHRSPSSPLTTPLTLWKANIAMEYHAFYLVNQLQMAVWNGHVSGTEGKDLKIVKLIYLSTNPTRWSYLDVGQVRQRRHRQRRQPAWKKTLR